jgi:hypothetical protein
MVDCANVIKGEKTMEKSRLKEICDFLKEVRAEKDIYGISEDHIHLRESVFMDLFPVHTKGKVNQGYIESSVVFDGTRIIALTEVCPSETAPVKPVKVEL